MAMSERVVSTLADGSARITTFLVQGRGTDLPFGAQWIAPGVWDRPITDAVVNHDLAKTGLSIVSWRRLTPAELPAVLSAETTYHAARVDVGGALKHDMVKAREIHRDLLRRQRLPLLDDLDRDYTRAVGQKLGNAELTRIEAERQTLRDLPTDPRIEAAATIEELKAVTVQKEQK